MFYYDEDLYLDDEEAEEHEDEYRSEFKTQLNDIEKFPQQIKDSIYVYSRRHNNFMNPKDEYITHRKNLLDAFDMISPLKENIVLYRGLSGVDEVDFKKFDKTFNSATTLRDLANARFSGDSCCILVINISSGSKVLPMIDHTKFEQEFEVLLPPYGTWELISSEIIDFKKTYFLNYKN